MGKLTKGMLIGGMIGTALGMVAAPEFMSGSTARKMTRTKRNIIKKTGEVIGSAINSIK